MSVPCSNCIEPYDLYVYVVHIAELFSSNYIIIYHECFENIVRLTETLPLLLSTGWFQERVRT